MMAKTVCIKYLTVKTNKIAGYEPGPVVVVAVASWGSGCCRDDEVSY